MSTPFEISDKFTDEWSDLTPIDATRVGIAGRDHLWDDLSPDGEAARTDLLRVTHAELTPHFDHPEEHEAIAAKVLSAWMDRRIADHERGKWKYDINHVYSPFQRLRDDFDVMSKEGAEAWANIATRLETFDQPLAGYRASLEVGLDEDLTAARRQVESVIEQVRAAAATDSRFTEFPELGCFEWWRPGAASDRGRQGSSGLCRIRGLARIRVSTPGNAPGRSRRRALRRSRRRLPGIDHRPP